MLFYIRFVKVIFEITLGYLRNGKYLGYLRVKDLKDATSQKTVY